MVPADAPTAAAVPTRSRWLRIVLLVTLFTWAAIPIAWVCLRAIHRHGALTGAVGLDSEDQLQYLAWVRDASHHVLVGNLYGSAPQRVFLQPMYLISGVLVRLGVQIAVSIWVWELVAIPVLVVGICRFAERFFPGNGARQLAFAVVALFPFTPLVALLLERSGGSLATKIWLLTATFEFVPSYTLWGFAHIALALGLMTLFVLRLEGIVDLVGTQAGKWTSSVGLGVMGAAVSWLHSWQGLTLLGIMVGLVIVACERRALMARLIVPAAITALPLAYSSLVVARYEAWSVFARQNRVGFASISALLVVIGPFVLVAALGLRGLRWNTGDRVLVLWLGAAAAVYLFFPEFRTHALDGISIPLATLCVRGWPRTRIARPIGAVALATLVLSTVVYFPVRLHRLASTPTNYWLLTPDQRVAMDFIERHPARGTVLSDAAFGLLVPSVTDRAVWQGHAIWTPDPAERARRFQLLVDGKLSRAAAGSLIVSSGASFVVLPCGRRPQATVSVLTDLAGPPHTVGCYMVFVVADAGSGRGTAADSRVDG